jgi:hypothetical protein
MIVTTRKRTGYGNEEVPCNTDKLESFEDFLKWL